MSLGKYSMEYIPWMLKKVRDLIKFRGGKTDNLHAMAEKIGVDAKHVDKVLREMGQQSLDLGTSADRYSRRLK